MVVPRCEVASWCCQHVHIYVVATDLLRKCDVDSSTIQVHTVHNDRAIGITRSNKFRQNIESTGRKIFLELSDHNQRYLNFFQNQAH